MTLGGTDFVAEFARIRTMNAACLDSGEFSYLDGPRFLFIQKTLRRCSERRMKASHVQVLASVNRRHVRNLLLRLVVVWLLTGLSCRGTFAQDAIEFLSGARLEGKVTRIDKTAKVVTFEALLGSRAVTREFPYDKIHAIQYQGKRYVLNEKADRASDAAGCVREC